MKSFKLKKGARAVWIGLHRPFPCTVISVVPRPEPGWVTVELDPYPSLYLEEGARPAGRVTRMEVELGDPYLVPRAAYRTVHAFKWELKPYRWEPVFDNEEEVSHE